MTRTFFIGEPTEKQQKVYDLVAKNHRQTIEAIKEGANTKQLAKMVENDFKLNNYDLIHSLGHGLGLEVHERPYLNCKIESILRENMTITVEPGIYIPGEFGVRIEDTILVEKGGCSIL
jgi:Xaa-Pro aminopeptidase